MDNYLKLLMIILLAWMIFVIIRFIKIYWCKKVFLLSSVVWINGRLTQNKGMKNLRFYDLKFKGVLYDDYYWWWLLLWWLLWWWFYDDYYNDYFMMIIMMMIILWLFYDDYFMMIILWWLFYDDFVLKMFFLKKMIWE